MSNTEEGWISQFKYAEIPIILVIRITNIYKKPKMKIVHAEFGDWSDLIYLLFTEYDQFTNDLSMHVDTKSFYDKIDEMAINLEQTSKSYSFVMADGTDDWFVALVKPLRVYLGANGEVK